MHKKAFTLVELIVVITILAILGTIAFISFQGYTKSARDSVRISDLKDIEKNLSLYKIQTGEYPEPSSPENVTYESKEVWTQGTVGQSVITNLDKLNKVPRDPLTGNEYTYSRLNTKKELQLACILEGSPVVSIKNEELRNKNLSINSGKFNLDSTESNKLYSKKDSELNSEGQFPLIPQANAADVKTIATAYVTGDYNGEIAKVNSGSTTYILAVPSIINGDMSLTDIIEVISNKKLVYNGYGNLPSSYTGTIFDMNGGFDYSETGAIVVYSGSINDLKSNEDARVTLISNLQGVYSGTILENTGNIKQLVETDIDTSNPTDEAKILACGTIDYGLGTITFNGCISTISSTEFVITKDMDLYNLSDYELKHIFSDSSYYTTTWNNNTCDPDLINIVTATGGTFSTKVTIPDNTVYKVPNGGYNLYGYTDFSSPINLGNCSAIIGESIDGVIFTINSPNNSLVFLLVSNKGILYNFTINGNDKSATYPSTFVRLMNSSTLSNLKIKKAGLNFFSVIEAWNYNFIDRIEAFDNKVGSIKILFNYNVLQNVKMYNTALSDESRSGIEAKGNYNIINNVISYNNRSFSPDVGTIQLYTFRNSVANNIVSFNNKGNGIKIENVDAIMINNAYLYNNQKGLSIENNNLNFTDYYFNNLYTYNNDYGIYISDNWDLGKVIKYYGSYKTFGNSNEVFIGPTNSVTLIGGTSGDLGLGLSNGLKDTTGSMNCTFHAQPNIVTSWGTDCSDMKNKAIGVTTPATSYNYGINIGRQTRPIRWNETSGVYEYYGIDGVDYDSSKFIGEW